MSVQTTLRVRSWEKRDIDDVAYVCFLLTRLGISAGHSHGLIHLDGRVPSADEIAQAEQVLANWKRP